MGRGNSADAASVAATGVQSPSAFVRLRRDEKSKVQSRGGECCSSTLDPRPCLDRDASLESQFQPGDGEKLRTADAEAFFFQCADRGVSGLPWSRTENGFRRASHCAGRGKIAGTGRGSAVAARRQK